MYSIVTYSIVMLALLAWIGCIIALVIKNWKKYLG